MYVCEVQTIREINCRTYINFNGSLSPNWAQLQLKSESVAFKLYAVGVYTTIVPSTISQVTSVIVTDSGCVYGYDGSSWANCSCYTDGRYVYVRLESYDTSKCTIPNDRAVGHVMIYGY